MLVEISEILLSYPDGKLMLNDPIIVKETPHKSVFTCWGLWQGNGLFLMDADQEWHGPIEENQINANLVINSIYQRLKIIQWKQNCKLAV